MSSGTATATAPGAGAPRRLAAGLRAGALAAVLLPCLGLAGELPEAEVLPRPEAMQAPGVTGLLSLPPRVAKGPARPLPAVLVLHDALGPDSRSETYTVQLLGAGIAVLDLLAEAPDGAVRAAAVAMLAADARIDPRRIGVLGFGAGAATAAASPLPARVLLYPGCASLPRGEPIPGAVLLAHGGADAANPEAACAAAADALAAAGAQVRRVEYAGAGYAWDRPGFSIGERAMVPAPGGEGRVAVQPWPALTEMVAAQVAGFFASVLGP
jgi:dienelactone hydrolase